MVFRSLKRKPTKKKAPTDTTVDATNDSMDIGRSNDNNYLNLNQTSALPSRGVLQNHHFLIAALFISQKRPFNTSHQRQRPR